MTAVFRMKPAERRMYAAKFEGDRVRVTFGRGYHEPITGRVVVVAMSTDGTYSDQIVVNTRGDGYFPTTYSLATVGTIDRIEDTR